MKFYRFHNPIYRFRERIISLVHLVALSLVLIFSGVVIGSGLLILLPFGRQRRLAYANWSMGTLAELCLWVCGHRWRFHGASLPTHQAIFVANHSSTVDTFLMPSLFPSRTSVIAKKEIIWFPIIGQLVWLAGFLLIDRQNPTRSAASLQQLAMRITQDRINLWLMPEGTRSRDGQLARFKTGFVHLAVATRLPVVPIVLHDTYQLWPAGTLQCRAGEVIVEVLPTIDTGGWQTDDARQLASMVREQIRDRLETGPLEASSAQ
ncbi:MAG TPA: hypothetical protein DEB46_07100 [Myxococcales bacterium]|nr:hypothetical protein [Myxococcales bacterium]